MDKNMINIDDLFRDRLSGGEERERTGAWLQMRDLLDKNMPVETTPVAFAWKRFAGYLVGAALLAALSVGGYKIVTHGHKDVADTEMNSNTSVNGADNHGTVSATVRQPAASQPASTAATQPAIADATVADGNANNNRPSGGSSIKTIAAGNQNGNSSRTHSRSNDNTAGSGNYAAAGTHAQPVNSNHTNHSAVNDRILKNEQLTGPNSTGGNGNMSRTDNGFGNMPGNNTPAGTIAASAGNSNNETAGNAHSVRPRNPEQVQHRNKTAAVTANVNANTGAAHTRNTASGNSINNYGAANTLPAANSNNSRSNTVDNTNITPVPAPALKKDTIEKIRLVQHYNRRRGGNAGMETFRMDTIGIEQMVVTRQQEGTPASVANTSKTTAATKPALTTPRKLNNTSAPATAAPAAAMVNTTAAAKANTAASSDDAGSNLVPLSNYRVASKKGGWDPQRFEDMITVFKFKMSQLKFYPGMVAGINATMFGPNSFGGFQLGLATSVAITDRLSLAAELKYISRFNSGVTVMDNYAGGPKDSVAIYNPQGTALEFMNYSRDSTHHYFNFSMLHSIEMPVSVKYSIGRFFMMGGLNFAYHIKVNAEEVKRQLVAQTIVPYNHPPINWPENKPSINISDFNSRFEIGGLFGIGYEMTPSVQLDLRMTKSFWDNARTSGARTVSDQLYKAPSMQLSIGYRFSQQSH